MPGYLTIPEYSAQNISVTPVGDLSANNIQSAFQELDSDLSGGLASKLDVQAQQSNRNLLYNGAMQVAQRGTSTASITANGYYTADRWESTVLNIGTWTQSVENDAPTGSGFRRSLKMLCTAADAAPTGSDQLRIVQRLEGQDVQRIAKGTSSAEQLTVSFWVKSNVTGTYIVEAFDVDNSRQVSASYSVSASATWEKKVVTFPADTTGAFDNDNITSLMLIWWLGAGSAYTSGTLNTSWASNTTANRAVGQTNLAAATNNYWQITGVQLEVGDTATEFEHLPFGVELARCQRYYYSHLRDDAGAIGSGTFYTVNSVMTVVNFPTTMRVPPTLVSSNGTEHFACYANGGAPRFNYFTALDHTTRSAGLLSSATNSNQTVGFGGVCYGRLSGTSLLEFDSEL